MPVIRGGYHHGVDVLPRDDFAKIVVSGATLEAALFQGFAIFLMHKAASKVAPLTTDRKSTRLNSSHANISYAVFCLKKNKPTRWPYLRDCPSGKARADPSGIQ